MSKCRKIELENKALRSRVATLDNITQKQADTIVRLQTRRPEKGRGTKTLSQYSRQHKSAKKKMLAANVQAATLGPCISRASKC